MSLMKLKKMGWNIKVFEDCQGQKNPGKARAVYSMLNRVSFVLLHRSPILHRWSPR
jgi:hypothetical protein